MGACPKCGYHYCRCLITEKEALAPEPAPEGDYGITTCTCSDCLDLGLTTSPPDDIAAPAHYVEGRQYEPHLVCEDWRLTFNLGSVVKYVARCGRKGDAVRDLKKARQYIDFEIERLVKYVPEPEGEEG